MVTCLWRGNPGSFPVTALVTKWVPMSAAGYLGYPEYTADSIALTRTSERWLSRADRGGSERLSNPTPAVRAVVGQLTLWLTSRSCMSTCTWLRHMAPVRAYAAYRSATLNSAGPHMSAPSTS